MQCLLRLHSWRSGWSSNSCLTLLHCSLNHLIDSSSLRTGHAQPCTRPCRTQSVSVSKLFAGGAGQATVISSMQAITYVSRACQQLDFQANQRQAMQHAIKDCQHLWTRLTSRCSIEGNNTNSSVHPCSLDPLGDILLCLQAQAAWMA